MNTAFQNSLHRRPQAVPPVWFMRQAGRYHQHYQKMRQKHSFVELCKIPELAAEVAWGPVQEFDFDVAILFSDILFPLECLGMGLEYTDGGPALGWKLDPQSFSKLRPASDAIAGMQFQSEAMKLTREKIPQNKSLIGFVGGPWTLFTYATQGKHDGSLIEAKKLLPILFERFCSEFMIPFLRDNIELQLKGGAEVAMIFDTAAGELDPVLYNHYVLPQVMKLAKAFPKKVGYYSKGTQRVHLQNAFFKDAHILAGLGFDHRWDLPNEVLREFTPGFVQGNFDQALLFQEDRSVFEGLLSNYFAPFKNLSPEQRLGWVSGLGHGVLPKTPERNVKLFVETLRNVFHR